MVTCKQSQLRTTAQFCHVLTKKKQQHATFCYLLAYELTSEAKG